MMSGYKCSKPAPPSWGRFVKGLSHDLLSLLLTPITVPYEHAQRHQKKKLQEPPKVSKRGRRLSFDEHTGHIESTPSQRALSILGIQKAKQCHDQHTSLFFRLPREIRDLIYSYCADGTIWISSNGPQGQLRAYQDQGVGREIRTFTLPRDSNRPARVAYTCPEEFGVGLLPLVKCCRRM